MISESLINPKYVKVMQPTHGKKKNISDYKETANITQVILD